MSLLEATTHAEQLAAARDHERAEELLGVAARLVDGEGDEDVLRRYARACYECIVLGTEALRLVQPGSGLAWANPIRARGLRQLDQARLGHREHIPRARSDIEAYVAWLRENRSVPGHLQRGSFISLAELDPGEFLLLEGRREEAAPMLERAVRHLDSDGAFTWPLEHAYSLLERALC